MSTDQVPLYLGIPLAGLCVVVTAAAVLFIVVMWKEGRF